MVGSDALALDEIEIFHAVVTWGLNQVFHDLEFKEEWGARDSSSSSSVSSSEEETGDPTNMELKEVVRRPLSLVRFPLMTPSQLVREVQPSVLVSEEVIIEALAYHADPTTTAAADDEPGTLVPSEDSRFTPRLGGNLPPWVLGGLEDFDSSSSLSPSPPMSFDSLGIATNAAATTAASGAVAFASVLWRGSRFVRRSFATQKRDGRRD